MAIRRVRPTPRWVIGSALALLLVLSELTHSGAFFSKATLSTLTPFVGVMLIASLGQAVVIGAGGIDLSIPSTMTLVGVVTLKVSKSEDDRLLLATAAVVGCCALIGLVNGLVVERLRLNPFVATLAVGQIVAGIARYVRGPVPQFTRVPPVLVERGRWNVFGVSLTLIVAAALVVIGALVIRATVAGRRLVAASASRPAATLIGVSASAYRISTYVIASLLAGIAALLLSGQLGAPDLSLGAPYLLATVVSVVLSGATLSGGRVDLIGVAMGAGFVTVLNHDLRVQGYSAGVAQLVQAIVLGGGLAAVYLIRSRRELWARVVDLTRTRPPRAAPPVQAIK